MPIVCRSYSATLAQELVRGNRPWSTNIHELCTINLAISDVYHLILLTLVLYRKITMTMAITGF